MVGAHAECFRVAFDLHQQERDRSPTRRTQIQIKTQINYIVVKADAQPRLDRSDVVCESSRRDERDV